MTQSELDCAVAKATGEPVSVIESRGFGLDRPSKHPIDDEPVLAVSCPFCGTAAILANTPKELPEDAECGRCETVFPYDDDEIYSISVDDLVIPFERVFLPAA